MNKKRLKRTWQCVSLCKGTPSSRGGPTAPPAAPASAKTSRGGDLQPRAKASSSEMFSSRWQRVEDISIADLRTLLFIFNEEQCEHELIKDYEKDDLLLVFEYATGLDRTHPLSHRYRVRLICCRFKRLLDLSTL